MNLYSSIVDFHANDVTTGASLKVQRVASNGWTNCTIYFPQPEPDGYTFEVEFHGSGVVQSTFSTLTFSWNWGDSSAPIPQSVRVILPTGYDVNFVRSNGKSIDYTRCAQSQRITVDFKGSAPSNRYFDWTVSASESLTNLPLECLNTSLIVPLTIQTPYSGVAVTVDGQKLATGADGSVSVQLLLIESTHRIQVQDEVDQGSGKHDVFARWGDGNLANPRAVQLNDSTPIIMIALYKTQFLLMVKSIHGTISGTGWYDLGSIAAFSVSDIHSSVGGLLGFLGARYVFRGWTGDTEAQTYFATITMNGPKTVEAQWETDYSTPILILSALITFAVSLSILIWNKRGSRRDYTRKYE
jgi:hypothetical protein